MKKVILMVFLIFSLLMIVYGIGFILNPKIRKQSQWQSQLQ